MAKVEFWDAIGYGVDLILYVISVILVSGLITVLGMALTGGMFFTGANTTLITFLGSVLVFLGVVVFYAGMLGIIYKVIADAVDKGTA